MATSTFAFVQVKAYGDFTIAAASLRRVRAEHAERVSLLISPHLSPLAEALTPPCRIDTLPLTEVTTPACFDPGRRSALARLRSAFSLRRALRTTTGDATLVMRHLTGRNRFITGGRRALALPEADTIYTAYERFLADIAGTVLMPAPTAPHVQRQRRIALCPYSRIPEKTIPADLVGWLCDVCSQAGHVPELVLLEGEPRHFPGRPSTRIIPRTFTALSDVLMRYAGVISADSLPAHLAEYRSTPTFVVSPWPNTYWLPPRAHQGHHWGVFGERTALLEAVRRFLHEHTA